MINNLLWPIIDNYLQRFNISQAKLLRFAIEFTYHTICDGSLTKGKAFKKKQILLSDYAINQMSVLSDKLGLGISEIIRKAIDQFYCRYITCKDKSKHTLRLNEELLAQLDFIKKKLNCSNDEEIFGQILQCCQENRKFTFELKLKYRLPIEGQGPSQ
jgi:hypothetical protein